MFEHSRLNLARWFTLSMGSILVIFLGLVYRQDAHDRLYFFDQALYNTSQVIASGVDVVNYNNRRQVELENAPLLGRHGSKLPHTTLVFARWYTPEKHLLQFMGELPAARLTDSLGFQTISDQAVPQERWRQLTLPVYRQGQLLGYLQVAASLQSVEVPLRQMRLFLAVGLPFTLGAIAAVGWWLGGMAMQPIRLAYQRLQQFTADASHELRAPLAAIISNAQVGLMEPTSPTEQADCLQMIAEAGESMSNLVGHLLFLARHQGTLPAQAFQAVDMVALLAMLGIQYMPQVTEHHLTLEVCLPKETLWVQGEPDLLRQAIANLLDNACRYTPSGGTIALRCQRQGQWVCIDVEDSGIGIAETDLPHIFERFYRVNLVRSRDSVGFGLGLAIVRQIVLLHSGQIRVASQLKQGSQFEIRLPLDLSA